eukprot:g5202.t1
MSAMSSCEPAEAAPLPASAAGEAVGLDYLGSLKGEQASQEALAREALVLHFDEFAASGDELEMYAFAILNTHGCRALNAPPERIAAFIHKIRDSYRDNPYHGWSHGFFVLRVTCLVLDVLPGLKSCLRPDEQCAYLIAALCHDVAHTGTNNAFEVKTKSPLALTYGDTSVLEKMHVAIMFQAMDDPAVQLFSSLEQEVDAKVRALMTSAVLMTDMMNHAGQVQDLKAKVDAGTITDVMRGRSMRAETQSILCVIMHAADISSHMMPVQTSTVWSEKVLEEFRAISAAEEAAGVALTPFLVGLDDPLRAAECQLGFLENAVSPLWTLLIDAMEAVGNIDAESERNASSSHGRNSPPESGGLLKPHERSHDLVFNLRKNLEENRVYWGKEIAEAKHSQKGAEMN